MVRKEQKRKEKRVGKRKQSYLYSLTAKIPAFLFTLILF
jgi:hypothetical protein